MVQDLAAGQGKDTVPKVVYYMIISRKEALSATPEIDKHTLSVCLAVSSCLVDKDLIPVPIVLRNICILEDSYSMTYTFNLKITNQHIQESVSDIKQNCTNCNCSLLESARTLCLEIVGASIYSIKIPYNAGPDDVEN